MFENGWTTLTLAQRDATPTSETTGGGDGTTGGGPAPQGGGGLIWIMIPFMVLMIVMMSMSGRKQAKRQKALMASLQKYDKVQTAGGILGTIVELKDHEVVIRTDEASNTRIRVVRSAVQAVLSKHESKGEAKGEAKTDSKAEVEETVKG